MWPCRETGKDMARQIERSMRKIRERIGYSDEHRHHLIKGSGYPEIMEEMRNTRKICMEDRNVGRMKER